MSTYQTKRNGFILGAVFFAFVYLTPAPARSEEKFELQAFRLTSPEIGRLKKTRPWNFQAPGLEPITEYGSFFGLKITLKVEGGWNIFGGGDIRTGVAGMYDSGVDSITIPFVAILSNEKKSNRGGLEVSGDLIYSISPRLGIGIGMARTSAWQESHLLYEIVTSIPEDFRAKPQIKMTTLRAGLFYSWPFAGILALSVRGGPALYSADYTYSVGCSHVFLRNDLSHKSYSQEASARQIGFEGGLGLELTPNPYVAIFVEIQGRYARIHDFEGDEAATYFQDGQYREDGQLLKSSSSGPVYFVDSAPHPTLDIIPSGENIPGNARKATLDFSGVTFLAGLKFRL